MKPFVFIVPFLQSFFFVRYNKQPDQQRPLEPTDTLKPVIPTPLDSLRPEVPTSLLVITTYWVSYITNTTVNSDGTASTSGKLPVTAEGFVWGVDSIPTIALPTKKIVGAGNGSFQATITGLSC